MTPQIVANRYELVRQLGEGGMGTVYEAYDRLNRHHLAFKQIRRLEAEQAGKSLSSRMNFRVALAREFQVLASLRHPHIINVMDYGFVDEEQPFFTMTLLQNPTPFVRYGQRQPLDVKVQLLVQMLQALAYLHRRGIIHRDLKPDNALVTEEGDVRLVDFGIAVPEQYHDERDGIYGTLTYIAPELLQGQPASIASDLYAVGVMAYEIFAQRYPFDTRDTNHLLRDIVSTMPDMRPVQDAIRREAAGLNIDRPAAETQHFRTEDAGPVTDKSPVAEAPEGHEGFETLNGGFDPFSTLGGTESLDPFATMPQIIEPEIGEDPFMTRAFDPVSPTPTERFPDSLPELPPDSPPEWDADNSDTAYLERAWNADGSLQDSDHRLALPHIFFSQTTGDQIAQLITRLMEKDPAHRYQHAEEVIEALCRALGVPPPVESVAIRESYLQAARFVGRDYELSLLMDSLQNAREGRGSAWLIGGESGVGKSRLLEELQTQGMVRGMVLLHGQGVVGGGLPYQLWREPLRRLALTLEISDLEASILREVVPDISELLERPVSPPPALEGQAQQRRLLETIGSLVRRSPQPLLLVLEDLQWADESLNPLRHLLPMAAQLPLFIVGSYRDDERPTLPADLAGMEVLRLERLSDPEIEALSVSMLGEGGRQPRILALLKKETEGNMFFLVEVVRALAEKAGRLDDIVRIELPEQVFAGGIETVVQQRLARVSSHARALLHLAAVAGRQLDLRLLQQLAPRVALEKWLTECANAAVLDEVDEQWRFAHEKLREGLLRSIAPQKKQAMHYAVAEGLSQLYQDNDTYAALIAQHYELAGAEEAAARWYVRAGRHAETSYILTTAAEFYRKALDYWAQHPDATQGLDYAEEQQAYSGLGTALLWQGQYAQSIEIMTKASALAEQRSDPAGQANALYGIASAYLNQGEFHTAIGYLEQAITLARQHQEDFQLVRALWLHGVCTFQLGNPDTTLRLAQESLTLAERIGNRSWAAQNLNLLGGVYYALGEYQQAAAHFQQAYPVFEETGERAQAVSVISNVGFLAEAYGDYDTAQQRYREALAIAREIGLRNAELLYMSNLGGVLTLLQEYDEAEYHLQSAISMAEHIGFAQLSESYRFLAQAYLGQSRLPAAMQAAQQAMQQGQELGSQEYIAGAWRVLGQVAVRSQRPIHVEGRDYGWDAAFQESERLYQELGLHGERARTLRAWAQALHAQGQVARGQALWSQAREIFQELGASPELKRMGPTPPG